MRAHIVEDGVVVNTILVDSMNYEPGEGQLLIDGDIGGIGWLWDGEVLSAPAVEPSQPKTVFSALEYLSKFTDAEYQAASTGTMRAQRALDMLIAAQFVDIVNDPRVPDALDAMIADCGMTVERKAELLTPEPIQPSE